MEAADQPSGGIWTQSIVSTAPHYAGERAVGLLQQRLARYFATVGMALRRGRDFSVQDTADRRASSVVNEALARHYFPRQRSDWPPHQHRHDAHLQNLEIVGVVQDAKYRTLQEPTRNIAYLRWPACDAAIGSNRDLFAVVRVASVASAAARDPRRARDLDRRVPVRIETVADRIRESTLNERLIAALAAGLGFIALILACAGLYGLLAYAVSRHGREIGLRIALGARRIGAVDGAARIAGARRDRHRAGLAAALALGRFVQTMLFQVTPADPLALAAASASCSWSHPRRVLPARRAASVDPVVALKRDS